MTWLRTATVDHIAKVLGFPRSDTWCDANVITDVVKEPKKPCLRCEDAAYRARKK